MGFNRKNVSLKFQGMRIMEVGTFDKKDIALLKQYQADEKKKRSSLKKEEVAPVRVKAKKIS